MRFDIKEVAKSLRCDWADTDFFLLTYYPKSSTNANEATRFVLAFKAKENDVVRQVCSWFSTVVRQMESTLRDEFDCAYVVAIPGSRRTDVSSPCEQVCASLDADFSWLTHVPGALERHKPVTKSAWAAPGCRPTLEEHKASIRYKGTGLQVGRGVILLDDVYTIGNTSEACRQILVEATQCSAVLGMFLGKTVR